MSMEMKLVFSSLISTLLVISYFPIPVYLRSTETLRCTSDGSYSYQAATMTDAALKFPDGFMWGTATASYQIEGAADEAREPSIWDRFSETPGKVAHGDTGKVACDHYHRYKEDVQLIKGLGTKYYRFSIAWPRIQRVVGDKIEENSEGIAFYNALIDELLANDITPYVTLYHWDLPLWVEEKNGGGWIGSKQISTLFADYARICFEKFGDRVKNWITLNEPWCSALLGYEIGEHAPGDTSKPGDYVYQAGHNLLLAHGRAVQVYKNEFQEHQKGKIGITLNSNWVQAKDERDENNVKSAQVELDFELGWFADPIWKGDYPQSMRQAGGDRLPKFTEEEKKMLKGSSDFFGLNHYSTHYSSGFMTDEQLEKAKVGYFNDRGTTQIWHGDWKNTDMGWAIVPWGFRNLLLYISNTYKPEGGIIVTENGLAAKEQNVKEMEEDTLRIEFYGGYISAMHAAIEAGADVRGYFLWSLMDNFEWAYGYEKRFGLHWVNYETQERIPKPAARWYANVTTSNSVKVGVCVDEDAEM